MYDIQDPPLTCNTHSTIKWYHNRGCTGSCIRYCMKFTSNDLNSIKISEVTVFTVQSNSMHCQGMIPTFVLSLAAECKAPLLSFHFQSVSRWTSASRMWPLPSPSSNSLTSRCRLGRKQWATRASVLTQPLLLHNPGHTLTRCSFSSMKLLLWMCCRVC